MPPSAEVGGGEGVLTMTEKQNERVVIVPEYESEYFDTSFVPFPSSYDAIEAIKETGGYIIDAQSRIDFYTDIINALRVLIDAEYEL